MERTNPSLVKVESSWSLLRNRSHIACAVLFEAVYGAPVPTSTVTMAPSNQFVVITLPQATQITLLWVAIGLAVITAFAQGLVTVMASVAEDANMWTFRFRLAKQEHIWWTFVSILLTLSLITITLSFMAGNNNDALDILALSSATLLAIVQYAIPAWRSRDYIRHRWLAWTGDSRTGIPLGKAAMCGDAAHWQKILRKIHSTTLGKVPSDSWGPVWFPGSVSGIPLNPAEMLTKVPAERNQDYRAPETQLDDGLGLSVYDDGLHRGGESIQTNVSLLWGEAQGFRRRVSRGISSMPQSLLKSKPLTTSGYAGEGLCLAMGVLGRNKGLSPWTLVFDADDKWKKEQLGVERLGQKLTTHLENTSTWFPRPKKALRSFYSDTMNTQYHQISKMYVFAAVELALIFADCPSQAIKAWLLAGLEQQSLDLNRSLRRPPINAPEELNACYRASYTSMIISLNYMPAIHTHKQRTHYQPRLCRPDLHCMALLLRALGAEKPRWWDTESFVTGRLEQERKSLEGEWKNSAAWLLGLPNYPSDHDFRTWTL